MREKTTQLSVMAVAALAVFAVAAVMLLSGGAPAQADTASLAPDSGGGHLWPEQPGPGQGPGPGPTPGPTPEPTPQQTVPEECLTPPVDVVSSGHYAIFEVYWNTGDSNLVNNPCPPEVTHNADETVTREASHIDIGHTIMHVSGDANLTPRANNAADYRKWPFLYPDAVDTNDNHMIEASEVGAPYSTNVWALHDCSHDANPPPTESDLCMGVSAGLLRSDDWRHIDFEMESVREPGIGVADRGQAFVFYKYDDVPAGEDQVLWGTHNAADTGIDIDAGEYLHPRWAFTQPGTYQFQVHVNGVPDGDWTEAHSLTSVVRTYTVHVGTMADLSIGVTATPESASPGDDVTVTISASNGGPDTATSTKVDVSLPEGLTLATSPPKAPLASTGTYDSTTDVWTIGNLAKDTSATLTITATVAEGTRGTEQKVKATIYATEHIGSSDVVELDPNTENNMGMDTVTVTSIPNDEPTLGIMCSVIEFSKPGTKVCDPVKVTDPNTSDTLTFGLTGDGADHFAVQSVSNKAQIVVAQGANIEHATRSSYSLTLTVSDGKDDHGNADASVDDSLDVMIMVRDFTVSLSASKTNPAVGEEVTFTVTLENPPVPVNELSYYWATRNPDVPGSTFEGVGGDGNPGTFTVSSPTAQTLVYRIQFSYYVDNVEYGLTNSDEITVTWAN